jgi:uncharacterized lipoprotein YbaY/heat shock protein HslJ/uncharacterized lipoprotein NlpE involved in copper resistance
MTPRICAAVLVSLITSGAALSATAQQTLLTGTISYRERMTLPPTAVVEVRLEDVSRVAVAPPVIARYRLADPGSVPIRFNLDVDTSTLDRLGRYALRATIMDGARVLFTSTDTVLVLTQGHGTRADLVLTRVAASNAPLPGSELLQTPPVPAPLLADLPATFLGTLPCADCEGVRYHLNLFDDDSFLLRTTRLGKTGGTTDDLGSWTLSSDRRLIVLQGRNDAMQLFEIVAPGTIRKLEADGRPNTGRGSSQLTRSSQFRPTDVRATMRGAYTYLADAATFVECSTGQRWTVAAENVSRELEAAYLKVRPAPGASVVVDVDGLLVQRPRPDGGTESALVVERVRGLLPKQSCPARFSGVPLTDTHWRLTHLGDRAVPVATDPRREPSLTLLEGTNSFAGSSGCNRLVGSYAISGSTMTLTSGGTMVACKEEAKTESAFLTALQATRTYRVTGRVLELTDAKGVRVARFEARLPTGITVR